MFDPFGIKRRQVERAQLVQVLRLLTNQVFQVHEKVLVMNQIIQDLVDAVTAERTEVASAVTLINGITDRSTAAVNAALAANPGVDLSPLVDLISAIKEETQSLSAAVVANQPQNPDPSVPVVPVVPVVTPDEAPPAENPVP